MLGLVVALIPRSVAVAMLLHQATAAALTAAGSQRPALEEAGPRSKTYTLLLFSSRNWLSEIPTWEIEISEVAFHLSSS